METQASALTDSEKEPGEGLAEEKQQDLKPRVQFRVPRGVEWMPGRSRGSGWPSKGPPHSWILPARPGGRQCVSWRNKTDWGPMDLQRTGGRWDSLHIFTLHKSSSSPTFFPDAEMTLQYPYQGLLPLNGAPQRTEQHRLIFEDLPVKTEAQFDCPIWPSSVDKFLLYKQHHQSYFSKIFFLPRPPKNKHSNFSKIFFLKHHQP